MAIYKDSAPITPIENINEAWEDKTGMEVEDFLCRQLKDAEDKTVSYFEFDQAAGSTLKGFNRKGEEITSTQVVNATPIYVPELTIDHIRINSNNNDLQTGQSIELNQPSIKKIEVGVKFVVKYEILGTYYYAISPQAVSFNLGGKTYVKDRVVPNTQANVDGLQYIEITDLFTDMLDKGVTNGTLQVKCTIGDNYVEDSYAGITVKKISLSYENKGYVEGDTISFKVSGLESYEIANYQLVYLDNGSSTKIEVPLQQNNKVDITFTDDKATHQLYARIEYKNNPNLFYSEWIQTNVIVNCNSLQGDAVAVINSVPTEINNCSNALLYKICYASGTNGGNIVINSYLSDTWDDFKDLANTTLTPFNSTTLTLMGGEEANEKEFYSFFELETVGDKDARYIGFTINGQVVYSYDNDGTSSNQYFTVEILENPYNINNAFNHVPGADLDYSQINGSGSNVFKPELIQLQPGDGWGIDGKYTAFQVSASGQNLFKTPIDLNSYLNNGFTFEFLVRTYNVNGDDYILRIGNLLLGPGYVRVYEDEPEGGYEDDGVFINSKADFQKDAITHILVTYHKGYLPKTYMDTYNQLLTNGTANYQTSSDVTPYNVLKIYINGVINREIQLTESQLRQNGTDFKLQVYPTSSDIKFYGFRTYNYPFGYNEVQKNYISSLLESGAKKAFYDKNDILDANGQISLRKCFNKYNVIVYAIPTADAPLYYGNKSVAGDEQSAATLLIHYADPSLVDYNGRMWDGKYKAQGSSAKKYLIHNCQYNIKKGKFLTEAEIAHNATVEEGSETYIKPRSSYAMPGSDIKAKKFVGKVNYASSMQTHKQGACNTYDDTYKSIFSGKLDSAFPLGTGRKTCLENEFLYFYYNITPEQDLSTITIQDTLDNAKFMGFQTWGSAKADDPTYGYDGDITLEYALFEGADNGNPGANFKVPWAAFQTYNSDLDSLNDLKQQTEKVTNPILNGKVNPNYDPTAGLLISDETIKYGKDNDPLDVDYGVTEGPAYNEKTNPVFVFEDAVKEYTLPRFVEFYNAMYQYDFTCLIASGDLGIGNTFDVSNTYGKETITKKIYISASKVSVTNSKDPNDTSITSAETFDVFRWDAIRSKWVPAGLHHSDTVGATWNTFNLVEQYKDYTNRELYKKYETTGEIDTTKFGYTGPINDNRLKSHILPAMKDMFVCACKEYTDVDDIAFHQAMIRVLSGTDNRAKNTYFQIIGKIYENGVRTDKGDYKVRLMQDDLDTIFATDNNGQQNKSYHLLEPAFNLETEGKWGDDHSSLFYPFDLCFADKINIYTGYIIHYLLEGESVESEGTKLYENFLRIQKYFPAIAYNHTAEIYYELAQTIFQNGTPLFQEGDFDHLLNNYVNNSVTNPLSLSHGSGYEGEVQFLKDRLLLLATLTGQGSGLQTDTQALVSVGSGDGNEQFTVTGNAKYINYFYPNYMTASRNYNLILKDANSIKTLKYDPLLDDLNIFPVSGDIKYDKTVVKSLSVPNTLYPISMTGPTLTGFAISNTSKYKYLEITSGLEFLTSLPKLSNVAYFIADGIKTGYKINNVEIKIYDFLPVIEELVLTNVPFNNTTLDFRNCNRLRKLDLRGCSKIQSIIFPEGRSLSEVILPACIKSISIINNPNLTNITFEEGTKLETLSINMDGVSSQFDINGLIKNYYDFTNPQLLKLIGDCVLDVEVASLIATIGNKASLKGSYTINDNGTKAIIRYSLKKSLVRTYGNIDNPENDVFFDYEHRTLSGLILEDVIFGCRYVEGQDNEYYPFESIDFEFGNDVIITSKGNLDITYSIAADAPATVDEFGKVKVTKPGDGEFDYKVVINSATSGAINAEGAIYFGYKEPSVGDLVYADGTFSKTPISSKTPVGIVYASRTNDVDSSKLDLAILGTGTVTGYCGPDYYTYVVGSGFNQQTVFGKNQAKVFSALVNVLYDAPGTSTPPLSGVGTYDSASYSPYTVSTPISLPQGSITLDTDKSYPKISGKANTYKYKAIADKHIETLCNDDYNDFGSYMRTNGFVNGANKIQNIDTSDFNDICSKFNSRIASVSNQGSLEDSSYEQLLYSAYYRACLYKPTVKIGETLLSEFDKGNWYVPSIEEIKVLVAKRIESTTTTNNSIESAKWWNSNNYSNKGIFNIKTSPFLTGFLTTLGRTASWQDSSYVYISSEVAANCGGSILYGENRGYSNNFIKWSGSWTLSDVQYPYYHDNAHEHCRRDLVYTLPICCEITVSKTL